MLADIIIFNARRSGEAGRIKLKHYINRQQYNYDKYWEQVLSEEEIKAKDDLDMFLIPGKRNRNVPVLLTKTMKKCIDLLVLMRSAVNIAPDNILLFARPFSNHSFDTCKIIRELVDKLHLKNPDAFRATGLRHEIATSSTIRDPTGAYTRILANHMGHDEVIHRSNYRLPMPLVQHARVGSHLTERRRVHDANQPDSENINSKNQIINDANQSDSDNINSKNQMNIGKENVLKLGTSSDEGITLSEECGDDPSYENISESDYSDADERHGRKKAPSRRIPWSFNDVLILKEQFKDCFSGNKNPGKSRCLKFIEENPSFQNRTWAQINSCVDNIRRKKESHKKSK